MNRAGLNGLCVAAGVCLLYVLFDPDMISWRERGPGRGQPENAPWPDSTPPFPHRPAAPASLSRAGDWPPACLWPAQVQLPSAPAFSPGPPPPGLGLPRGCSAGLRGGAGLLAGRGRGSILPDCVSGDIRWEAAPPRTQAHYPFLDEAVGVLVGSGVTRINLNGSPFSRSEGAPPARGRSTKQQSQQRLAEDSGCGGGADRAVQLSPRPGRSPPRSTLLGLLPGLSRAPRPHQEGRELRSTDPTCSSSLRPPLSLQRPDGFPENANSITSLL